MATSLQLDDGLIVAAVKLGGHRTKKAAVTRALKEYVERLQQQKVLEHFGKVEYGPKYDYKKQRGRSDGRAIS